MDYLLHVLVLVLIYGMVALSLNLASGFTRLISLAQAGFFGTGAYVTAILMTRYDVSFWCTLPIGMALAGIVALPAAIIAMRTIEDHFVMCTMGIGIIVYSIMNNWLEVTRGPLGIAGVSPPAFPGGVIDARWKWTLLAAGFYVVVFLLTRNVKLSAMGRLLVAISEDEVFCESLGKDVGEAKLRSFVVAAILAAPAGALYAGYVSYVDPSSFGLSESIFVLSIMILGGLGNLWGSLAAAAFMVGIPELLRFLGLPAGTAGHLRQILFAAILVTAIWINARRRSTVTQGPRSA